MEREEINLLNQVFIQEVETVSNTFLILCKESTRNIQTKKSISEENNKCQKS